MWVCVRAWGRARVWLHTCIHTLDICALTYTRARRATRAHRLTRAHLTLLRFLFSATPHDIVCLYDLVALFDL